MSRFLSDEFLSADSSLIDVVFFLLSDSLSFFLGGVGGSSHPSGTKLGSSLASISSRVAFSKSGALAQIRSHIFLDIHPPTSFSSLNGSTSSSSAIDSYFYLNLEARWN